MLINTETTCSLRSEIDSESELICINNNDSLNLTFYTSCSHNKFTLHSFKDEMISFESLNISREPINGNHSNSLRCNFRIKIPMTDEIHNVHLRGIVFIKSTESNNHDTCGCHSLPLRYYIINSGKPASMLMTDII